jgi:hypothetical protein
MNPTFKKHSGAQIIRVFWRSRGKLTQGMCFGVNHVLAMSGGKRSMICFARFDRKLYADGINIEVIRNTKSYLVIIESSAPPLQRRCSKAAMFVAMKLTIHFRLRGYYNDIS